jgi:uncharacterized protein (DUF58 family)
VLARAAGARAREYTLQTRRRGISTLGPAAARSTDPFALFHDAGDVAAAERLVVYPRMRALPDFPFASDDPFGSRRAMRRLFDDPNLPMGIRAYAPGDGFRDIHWPATARTGSLQTRVNQPVAGLDLVVCLNAATYDRHWEGYDPERTEALVETSATLVTRALSRAWLISSSSIAHLTSVCIRVALRRPELPRMLARLTPIVRPRSPPTRSEAPALAYGSTLIVVTALTPPRSPRPCATPPTDGVHG